MSATTPSGTTSRAAERPRAAPPPLHASASPAWLKWAVGLLLGITFAAGGGSQDNGPGDALAQLLALPVLVAAVLALSRKRKTRLHRAALGIAACVVALPAVQLLPLPQWLWALPSGREALLADLQAAGVTPRFTWTLTPDATEQALWSQLPAVAAFLAALVLGTRGRLGMVRTILGLVTAGLLLGVLQMAAGQHSPLNLFPQWVPVIGGVFANPNHQAVALIIGSLLGVGLWLEARHGAPIGTTRGGWVGIACAGACLLGLPFTQSRAGMLLALPALGMLLWTARRSRARDGATMGLSRKALVAVAGLAVAFLAAAGYLLAPRIMHEDRWPIASATFGLARDAWPLGTGVGSFRAWFEQTGPDSLLTLEFINHAHNEYLQWWLEGGLVALVLLAAALALLFTAIRGLFDKKASPINHAAWLSIAVLLASSMVDYPLRTPALMAIGGFLAGMVVARAARPRKDRDGR